MPGQELQEIIEMLKERSRAGQENQPTLEERRAGTDAMGQKFEVLNGVTTEAVDADGVPAEWVLASNAEVDRVMLYLHGGGYVLGSIASHRGLAANLSRATHGRVLLIDYRLAPEHPFPAAVEDATTAYRWLVKSGADPARVTVAGDSAGGGLTVATLVALRDSFDPLPAAGVCISPWVDMEAVGESMTTRSGLDPMVQQEGLLNFAGMYLNGADPRSPLAAPLYADLKGIPPLLIQVGTAETLYDDSTRLVERARASGVDAVMEPWDEMVHIWPMFAPFLPEGQQAVERIGEYVRERTGVSEVLPIAPTSSHRTGQGAHVDRAVVDGITLEYEASGTGDAVVFIHGAFIADAFKPLVAESSLADHYRLITYHRRGYMGSGRTPGPISVPQQAADCRGLMRYLGLEQVHVVGHSAGGAMALQFALDYPEVVHSLALLEPALMVGASAQVYRESLEQGARRYREAGAETVAEEFFRARWPGYLLDLEHMLPGGFDQAVANASATWELDMGLLDWHFGEAEVRRITQPALVVLGGGSVALSPRFEETQRFLLSHLPNAEGFVLPDATHFLHLETPEAARAMAEGLAHFYARHAETT